MADLDLTKASKGELADEVVRLRGILDRPSPAQRSLDAESLAIDRCATALDPLAESWSSAFVHSNRVERVLRYLAHRFNVDLVEQAPCDRRHVDELPLLDLNALLSEGSQ